MRMQKHIILGILSLFTFVQAQNFFPVLGGQRVGTSVFTFLKIGVSARAVGMGEAVVALDQNASSIYYNPGIIAQLEPIELSASHIQWPAEIAYDFFAITKNIYKRHYLGLTAGILHMEPMQETTEYNPHGTGNYFTFQNTVLGLTYGVRMTDRFSFGITGKWVREDLAGTNMDDILLDLGTFYWTGFKSLRFSASLSHFGSQAKPDGTYLKKVINSDTGEEHWINSNYESFSPPTIFRVGAAMDVLQKDNYIVTSSIQLNHPVDNAENVSAGIEYTLRELLYLRGGVHLTESDDFEKQFSFGAGLRIPLGAYYLSVDYAYTNFLHLSDPNRITIGLNQR